jgi:hypothetical protein
MMQAPKDAKFTKMICIETVNFIDEVWGDCSVVEGQSYDVLFESESTEFCMVRFKRGICPYKIKMFKSEAEILLSL